MGEGCHPVRGGSPTWNGGAPAGWGAVDIEKPGRR